MDPLLSGARQPLLGGLRPILSTSSVVSRRMGVSGFPSDETIAEVLVAGTMGNGWGC